MTLEVPGMTLPSATVAITLPAGEAPSLPLCGVALCRLKLRSFPLPQSVCAFSATVLPQACLSPPCSLLQPPCR